MSVQDVGEATWRDGWRVRALESWTGLSSCIGLVLVLGGITSWAIVSPIQSEASSFAVMLIAMIFGGWLIFQFARAARITAKFTEAVARARNGRLGTEQRNKASKIERAGCRELFFYTTASLVILATLGFSAPNSESAFLAFFDADNSSHLTAFTSLIFLSFVPLVLCVRRQVLVQLQTSKKHQNHSGQAIRDNVVSPETLGVASAIALAISILAYFAGKNSGAVVQDDWGIIVMMVVVLAFLLFIGLPHLSHFLMRRGERAQMQNVKASGFAALKPHVLASRADSVLVNFVAPLTGATQNGAAVPHLLLVAIMIPLTALGFLLPPPYGLVPIVGAIVLCVSLGRRWAWVEDDRDTASRLQSTKANDIHIGFANDLKDEALLGYAFLFVLVPLALRQINGIYEVFSGQDANDIGNWIRFFGMELAKAVPFVDWAEIYGFEANTQIETGQNSSAKHLVFGSRVMVDFVIMAALFQALSIWQRSRTQHKLYRSGQLDAFDPFTERSFFERGMRPASQEEYMRSATGAKQDVNPYVQVQTANGPRIFKAKADFVQRVSDHIKERSGLLLPEVPYSQKRLSELINGSAGDTRVGALWMAEAFDLLVGSLIERLSQLETRWALMSPCDGDEDHLHQQRMLFEELLAEALHPRDGLQYLRFRDVRLLTRLLSHVKESREFINARLACFKLFAKLANKHTVKGLMTNTIAREENDPELLIKPVINLPNCYLGREPDRAMVYHITASIDPDRLSIDSTEMICSYLSGMAKYDRSQSGRAAAAQALAKFNAQIPA